MKISIIVPIYNTAPYMARCLNSILAQDYKGPLECILVDDCTPDRSMDIAHEMLDDYQGQIEFKYQRHETNKGLSAARNTGIRCAEGEYLYFLDSDDEITPNCISALTALAEKYKGVDIVQGNIVLTHEVFTGFDISQYHFPEYTTDQAWIRKEMLERIPMTMWNKLIRHDLISEHGLWFKEGIIHEDEHWRMFYHKEIASFAFSTIPTYHYYQTEGSITQTRYKDKSFHTMLTLLEQFANVAYDKEEYDYLLYQITALQCRTYLLQYPDTFDKACSKFLHTQLHKARHPRKIRCTLWYLLRHSSLSRLCCRLFARPVYDRIRQSEQNFARHDKR